MVAEPDRADAFTVFYDKFYPRVHAYVVSRTGRTIAEDVASETFCVAWRRFADVPSPELPWLLGIARNVLRESFRAQAKQESLAAELAAWTSSNGPDTGELVAERTSVLRGLAALSDQDRELLTLVAWHGLTPEEAAKVVGCSKATYFVRLHRARKRLERAMAGTDTAAPTSHARRGVRTFETEMIR